MICPAAGDRAVASRAWAAEAADRGSGGAATPLPGAPRRRSAGRFWHRSRFASAEPNPGGVVAPPPQAWEAVHGYSASRDLPGICELYPHAIDTKVTT